MRWQQGRKSRNVEDRRGGRGGTVARRGGGSKMGGLMTIGIVIAGLIFGFNPMKLINMTGGLGGLSGGGSLSPSSGGVEYDASAKKDDQAGQFVSSVLASTEDTWTEIFANHGARYQAPKLVLFSNAVASGCGTQSSAAGHFYCPGDSQVYIDTDFFNELQKMGAPGDFAMAYVVAHEAAHHVQNLLGITREVQSQRRRLPEAEYNELSVKLELQADFLAGVWAHHGHKMKGFLEEGDIEEALNAAHAIGDDTIQKRARGYVVPDSFTHGTSEQRIRWFRKGLETGDLSQGDTFNARVL